MSIFWLLSTVASTVLRVFTLITRLGKFTDPPEGFKVDLMAGLSCTAATCLIHVLFHTHIDFDALIKLKATTVYNVTHAHACTHTRKHTHTHTINALLGVHIV